MSPSAPTPFLPSPRTHRIVTLFCTVWLAAGAAAVHFPEVALSGYAGSDWASLGDRKSY